MESWSFDAKIAVEQVFEIPQGGAKFGRQTCGGTGEGVRATLGESATGIGFGNAVHQKIHVSDAGAGGANLLVRGGFGDLAVGNTTQLAARKQAATHGTLLIDRAMGIPMGAAGLVEILRALTALHLQPQRRQCTSGIAGLEHDGMEQHAIAAHPARGAKARGGGGKIGDHGAGEWAQHACGSTLERLYSEVMTNGDSAADETILVRAEPIELCQLLKFSGLANTGGEAKMMIGEGLVWVNGEVDTRKRRKLVAGDRVTLGNRSLVVALEK